MKTSKFLLIFIVVLSLGAIGAKAETWSLTPTMTAILSEDGRLTISTTQAAEAMPDFYWDLMIDSSSAPWGNYHSFTLVIEKGVTSIGTCAFLYCSGLSGSLIIPEGVTTIGNSAFAYCTGLSSISNFATTPQIINGNVFSGLTLSNMTLHVPAASLASYQTADVWKDFGTIIGDLTSQNASSVVTNILDFESDELGQTYPSIAWGDGDITAVVENKPGGDGKALHIINSNWNSYPKFSLTLPEDKTLADIEKISFDLYFESVDEVDGQIPNSYKNFDYFFGTQNAYFVPNESTGSSVFLVADPSDNPLHTWLTKEFVPAIEDENLLPLNEFDFALGMNINAAGNYFLDNITFVLKDTVSEVNTIPIPQIEYEALIAFYNATGGAEWFNKWNIASNNLNKSSWYGVSISDGHVVAIQLPSNNLTGTIPDLSSLPYLKILDLSYNSISSMETVLPTTITTLRINNQQIDYGEIALPVDISELPVPKISIYNHTAQNFSTIPTFDVYVSSIKINPFSLPYVSVGVLLDYMTEDIKILSGTSVEIRQTNGTATGTSLQCIITYKQGDANVDGLVNVLDIQQTLNYILMNKPVPFNYGAANMNNDAAVNVQDLVLMVSAIQTNPLEAESLSLRSADEQAELQVENETVYLITPVDVAAFDIRISGVSIENIKNLLKDPDIQLSIWKINDTDQISVLAFSLNGNVIPAGKIPLFTLGSGQVIEQAVLATQSAKSIDVQISNALNAPEGVNIPSKNKTGLSNAPNPFSWETQFIYYLPEMVTSAQIRIYNISGQLVEVVSDLPVEQGRHVVTYRNNHLSAGIYQYVLEAVRNNKHSVRQTSKMWIKK